MKKFLVLALGALLLLPMLGFTGILLLMNPAAGQAVCATNLVVGPIPDQLEVALEDGTTVVLGKQQLTHAGTIITVGATTNGVGREGILVALMAALTESTLRQLANSVYAESSVYPNDGVAKDHDSLGLFQMRPQAGWGSVEQLMNPRYQAAAFYGGPTGPNAGSPRGLLDIPGWRQMSKGEAAQAVEVSQYPDRYANWATAATTILGTLTRPAGSSSPADPAIPETTRLVFPLPSGTYTRTSTFGWRTDPISGASAFHTGTDWAAPAGTPILAVADGRVVQAGMVGGYSGEITIEHTIGGERVATRYVHMWSHGIHVQVGAWVSAGQHIGDVGSSGYSTGAHLHLEILPGGAGHPPVDAEVWLADHDVAGVDGPTGGGPGCAF